ncbi:MAG: thioesterase family protein [Desulfobacterales bacterium]|jgi:acyl-CoA thioesterase FadM
MTRVEIDYPKRTLFTCTAAVRISDLSAAMHLGFDSLVCIVNDASAQFFRHIGLPRERLGGFGPIYADLAVVYRSEAYHGDELTIDVAAEVGTPKRLDLVFRVARKESGREVALARIGVLFFDYREKKVVPIPEEIRKRVGGEATSGKDGR